MTGILAVFLLATAQADRPGTETPFHVGEGTGESRIWGRAAEFPRACFDGFLPAMFERTLVFDVFDPRGGRVEWIFTGDEAGFTVRVEAGKVTLLQRWYDSFGHNALEGQKVRPQRHPEKAWRFSEIPLEEPLRELRVETGHRLDLAVTVNREKRLEQKCEFDVRRHQLFLSGRQGTVKGRLAAPPVRETTVRIDRAKRFQEMLGWGGIGASTAYALLSEEGRRQWWRTVAEYNLLIQREYPIGTRLNREMDNWERLKDATPHYYGDNFPNGEVVDFEYNNAIRKLGGLVMFEFWELPPWASRDWTDPEGRIHKGAADPDLYVEAVLGYVRASVRRSGVPPEIVGLQNEREQPAPVWHAMHVKLREGLDRNGFKGVKIHGHDSATLQGGLKSMRRVRESPAAWAAVDYSAVHMYDFQGFFTDPDRFDGRLREWVELTGDRPFISTELCVNDANYQVPSYRAALAMGQLYHKNLALTNAVAICYCWTILDVEQPSFGRTRSLFVPDRARGLVPRPSSHHLRVFGAFSRRVRRGMTRVGAESSDPGLWVTAYEGKEGATVVMLNRSAAPQKVRVEGTGAAWTDMEVADPYEENAVRRPDPAGVVVPPGAFVTLTTVPLGSAGK